MRDTEYREPYDLVLDWKDEIQRDFTPEEQEIATEAEAQIAAYTGRSYGEIRMDIARCAVAQLDELQKPDLPDNITPIRATRTQVYAATRYIATTSVIRS